MLGLVKQRHADCFYHAAFYLLSIYGDIANKAYSFMDSDGIDFEGILGQVFSSGEWRLVKVAYSLFSQTDPGIPLYELANFSHADFSNVCDAMHIMCGQYKVVVRENAGSPALSLDKSGYQKVESYSRMAESFMTQQAAGFEGSGN
jgi:hypothetical protein